MVDSEPPLPAYTPPPPYIVPPPAKRVRPRKPKAAELKHPPSALDRAVEALVADHTSGAVIDAAWAAADRLHPRPSRAR